MEGKDLIKVIVVVVANIVAIYLIFEVVGSLELVIGFITLSVGILTIFWTLLSRSSLSRKSNLRLFTTNFLACSIAVIGFSITRVAEFLSKAPWLIFVEYFFILVTFFFFLLASYYIYSIGREFGFQKESRKIEQILSKKKNGKTSSNKL